MNKTITANIGGVVFHVDESAYEALNKYLDSVKKHFGEHEGKTEIAGDIEARIAEILQEKLTVTSRQVVSIEDVNRIIVSMGLPEDFGATEKENTESSSSDAQGTSDNNQPKRFFRNPDEKIAGGVCGGIATYFAIDPLWLRLAFVLAFIIGIGSSIVIYIILWIIIPEAKTTTEKLQMKGEPVNISNIEKTIRKEAEQLKSKLHTFKNTMEQPKQEQRKSKTGKFLHHSGDFFLEIIKSALLILSKLVSIALIIAGTILIIALTLFILNILGLITVFLPDLHYLFTEHAYDDWLIIVALVLLVGVPVISLMAKSLKMLLGIKQQNLFSRLLFSLLWLAGIIAAAAVLFSHASFFREKTITKKYIRPLA